MGPRSVKTSRLLGLLLLALACGAASISAPEPRQPSSHGVDRQQSQQQQQQRLRLPRRLLTNRHANEIASTESVKKLTSSSSSTHRLIGGHLRAVTSSDNSEDGLLLSSAGNGKEKKSTSSYGSSNGNGNDDDDKKTLSQQVKEGKYGLIQNELFADRPRRPGIISYSANPEVPRDSLKNLGGLDEDEIWLAEDHVLVIKGGNFPKPDSSDSSSQSDWKPIDDYEAPQRQVKIPTRPRVPPPFPVQLTEGGPVQLIGANGSSVVDNGTIDFEALPEGFKGFLPGEGPYFPLTPNLTTPEVSSSPQQQQQKSGKASEGQLPHFYGSLPPGAVIVPPPSNQTDYDDEDQSMYYPPPYSFVYPRDNATDIPPGPLVPGIILPPPPDFFSPLGDHTEQGGAKRPPGKDKFYDRRPLATTPLPSGRVPPRSKSSTKLYKTNSVTSSTPLGTKILGFSGKFASRPKYKNQSVVVYQAALREKTIGTTTTTTTTTSPARPPPFPAFVEVTTPVTPSPIIVESTTTTQESPTESDKYFLQPIISNQVLPIDGSSVGSTEKPWRQRPVQVSSKPVPLVTFFASTTPSSIEQPVETTPSAVKTILTTESPTRYPSQASYYFYEEAPTNGNQSPAEQDSDNVNGNETPSSTQEPAVFFGTTAETPPYYKLQEQEQEREREPEKKDYYDVEMIPARQQQQTSKDYSVKLIDAMAGKDPQIYRYVGANEEDNGNNSNDDNAEEDDRAPVRSQSPRMLHSEPLYFQPIPTRPTNSPPKLSYFATPKPKSQYAGYEGKQSTSLHQAQSGKSKPKPIYQYSFEATNYSKRGRQVQVEPRIQPPRRHKELPIYAEYQDIQAINAGGAGLSGGPQDQIYADYGEQEQEQVGQAEPKLPAAYHHHPSSSSSSTKKERAYYQPQSTTVSPVRDTTLAAHQQYFTKQDEQLLDDVTKEYFTMFGKKLPSTTPIYGKSSVTERPAIYSHNSHNSHNSAYAPRKPNVATAYAPSPQGVRVHYGDHTPGPFVSLKDDVLVNYRRPLPPIEPEAEFISVVRPQPQPQLQQLQQQQLQQQQQSYSPSRQRFDDPDDSAFVPIADPRQHRLQQAAAYRPTRPVSLEGDIDVNYKDPRPQINPDAEFLPGVSGVGPKPPLPPNSYFAYRLPGDGGHFYFLTPQAVSRDGPNPAQYLYSRPTRGSRLLRRRRGRDGD